MVSTSLSTYLLYLHTLSRFIDTLVAVQSKSFHEDILVVDSSDSYLGLARKTFAFHCWAHDHFPNLEYSMKTDDDVS